MNFFLQRSELRLLYTFIVLLWLVFGLIGTASLRGQPVFETWVQRYNSASSMSSFAKEIATDGEANVIVVGYTTTENDEIDWVTIKYSNAGSALWTNRYHSKNSLDDFGPHFSVALDSSNRVFVTGSSYNVDGLGDFTTIAYAATGTTLWTNHYGSSHGDDRVHEVAVNHSGTVFVSGQSQGDDQTWDYATVAYSNTGVALWTNRYPGTGNAYGTAVTTDDTGKVFVTGSSYSTNSAEWVTLAYSSAGKALWTNYYGRPGSDYNFANAIAANNGRVFVTGQSSSLGGNGDYSTVSYSALGEPLWTNYYNGLASDDDHPIGIALGSNGNVYVTGSSIGAGASYDFLTIAYSEAGVALWTDRYGGAGNSSDHVSGIALDETGNVFVTGSSRANGTDDYVTLAYSATGVPLWTNGYNGPVANEDTATALTIDKSGSVFVTGCSMSNGGNYDFATIKYSTNFPPPYLHFQVLNEQLVLTWTNPSFTLQAAPTSAGSFTNIPDTTSPYTTALTEPERYFRLKAP